MNFKLKMTNIIISIKNNKLVRDPLISKDVSILLYLPIIDKKQVKQHEKIFTFFNNFI